MPSVSTSLVLARPGTPTSSAWPPASSATSVRSTTFSWPKITRPTPSRTLEMSASACSASATMSFSLIGFSLNGVMLIASGFLQRSAAAGAPRSGRGADLQVNLNHGT